MTLNIHLTKIKFKLWRKYLGVVSIFVVVGSSLAHEPSDMVTRTNQPAQIWEYVISYLNVPSTRLQIAINDTNLSEGQWYHQIQVKAKTYGIFSSLFHVTNSYTTLIDPVTQLPLIFSKQVHQKNIQQAWTISYDQVRHFAAIDSTRGWRIPPNCHTYFSMLWYLQDQGLELGTIYTLNLDVENLSYQVQARVKKKSYWI